MRIYLNTHKIANLLIDLSKYCKAEDLDNKLQNFVYGLRSAIEMSRMFGEEESASIMMIEGEEIQNLKLLYKLREQKTPKYIEI